MFLTHNLTKMICLIQIVKNKPTILFRSFIILYDVGHDYWSMFIASKLNVGLIVLLYVILLCFFTQMFLCVVELMYFGLFELRMYKECNFC
jgi:hypothetical protein